MLAPLTKTTPAAEPCYSRAKHNRVLSQITMLFGKNKPAAEPFYSRAEHNRVLSQITMLVLFLTKTTPAAEPCYAGAENNPILSQITMLFGKNKPAAESFYPRARHNRILSQITMLFPFDKNKPAAKPCYSVFGTKWLRFWEKAGRFGGGKLARFLDWLGTKLKSHCFER